MRSPTLCTTQRRPRWPARAGSVSFSLRMLTRYPVHIVGPAATLRTSGTAAQDLSATTLSYDFGTSGNSIGTVNAGSNLTITGLTADGSTATTAAPNLIPGTTLSQYGNELNGALTSAGITGVSVSSTAAGVLSISGANISTSDSLIQDPVATAGATGNLTFDSSGNLVSPSADVSGISFAGLSDGAATMLTDMARSGRKASGR